MEPFEEEPVAYTDRPAQSRHWLVSILQLYTWMIFHPSAWKLFLERIAPDLPPYFSWSDLRRQQWADPVLRSILLKTSLAWLGMIPILILLNRLGYPQLVDTLGHLIFFTLYGSLFISHIFGAVFGLLFGILGVAEHLLPVPNVAGILAVGMAGVIFARHSGSPRRFLVTGHWFLSIFIGLAISSVVVHLGALLDYLIVTGLSLVGVDETLKGILAVSAGTGIVVGTTLSLAPFPELKLKKLGRGLVGFFSTFGFLVTVALLEFVFLRLTMNRDFLSGVYIPASYQHFFGGAQSGMLYASFMALAFLITNRRIHEVWTSLLAGVSTYLVIWNLFLFFAAYAPGFSVAALLLEIGWTWLAGVIGLTFQAWSPFLVHLATIPYNYVLLWHDEFFPHQAPWLRYHSAFWDELQYLPLFTLCHHVVLVAERDPDEGRAAIQYLSRSRQHAAAQAAKLELDARSLERCQGIQELALVHQRLAIAGIFPELVNEILFSFKEISQAIYQALHLYTNSYHQRLALATVEERLDLLMMELTRSSQRSGTRFSLIATRWKSIVQAHRRELESPTQELEIPNPYIVGNPLTEEQKIFIGRRDLGSRIETLLLETYTPPLFLYGQRRMGKTSLLQNLRQLMRNDIEPFFLDGQELATASSYPDLIRKIMASMASAVLHRRKMAIQSPSWEQIQDNPTTIYQEWLDSLARKLRDQHVRTILIVIDEFEALYEAAAHGSFNERDFLNHLRHMIQHRPDLKLLVASSYPPAEFERWQTYLINLQIIKIDRLKEEEALQLITAPVQNFKLKYEPDALSRVLALTQGHPCLTQLFCSEMVTLKNEQPLSTRFTVSADDIPPAVRSAFASGAFIFHGILSSSVALADREALSWMAAQADGGSLSRAALERQFPADLNRLLRLLLKRDLLQETGDGYRFQVELIRLWLETDR